MISSRLKQLRSHLNLTQSDLASVLGIAKTTLAAYEQEKSEPNIETLTKMANYFDVTIDYLLGRSDGRILEDQSIYERFGLTDEAIMSLEAIKRISNNNNHTQSILKNINALIGDTETLLSISSYLDAVVKKEQYVVCKYYISQNGEDLIEEPDATEKLLNYSQWENIFFSDIEANLSRLKKAITKGTP